MLTILARWLLGATALALAPFGTHPFHQTPAPPALAVLPPSGPFHVGTVSREIADPARHGSTMIQFFYPTTVVRGVPAAYMPKKTADVTARMLQQPPQLVEGIKTGALEGAPVARGVFPVVLFSPGLTELRSDSTALTEDLASRGYVVVAIDHPTETAVIEFPNGKMLLGTFHDSQNAARSSELRGRATSNRVGDVLAVVAALPGFERAGFLANHLDLTRIGMFGYSLGGAATAEAMRAIPQIRAGVDLDGSLYGSALTKPLRRPFLFVCRDGHSNHSDSSWASDWSTLKGYRQQVHLIGSGHGDFADTASFLHQLDPTQTDPSGFYGPIDPDVATTATRRVLAAFFDRFLRGATSAQLLLNDPASLDNALEPLRP